MPTIVNILYTERSSFARRTLPNTMPRPQAPREFLIGSLAYALYWVDESLQRSLEQAGWPRISRNSSLVMVCITAGIDQPSQVARALGISRQAVHQILRGMHSEGLVELIDNPEDSRTKLIRFLPGTENLRAAAERATINIEQRLAERIGNSGLVALRAALAEDWGPLVDDALTSDGKPVQPKSSR